MTSIKFIEGVGGGLAKQWLETLFTQAFVFWLGGGLAALHKFGWQTFHDFFTSLPEPLPVGFGLLLLVVVVTSGFVVQQFEVTVIRLLEGYWPGWCYPLQKQLESRQRRKLKKLDQQLQDFNIQGLANLSPEARQTYIRLDLELAKWPEQKRLLPTRLGNILRASEDNCALKYGLDAIICWPRLWLLLADGVKSELSAARNRLNSNARLWLWSLLFLVWSPILRLWWPIPLGLGSAWLAHCWIIQAARVYGELVESAFDLYRFQLYQALHWPLPTNPAEEQAWGQQFTDYLWHGSDKEFPDFTDLKP